MKLIIKIFSCILIILPIFLQAQTAKELFEDKLSPASLLKDVDNVYKELNKNHPNLNLFLEKDILKKKFDSLKKTIKTPLTRMEFRYKLLTVLQNIGDGHLTLNLNASSVPQPDYDNYLAKQNSPIQQFDFKVLNDSLYVTGSWQSADIPIGAQVVSINGVPAKELISKMCNGLCADGYNKTFKYFMLNAGLFSNVYSNTFGYQDSINFEIKTSRANKTVILATKVGPGKPLASPQKSSTFKFSNDWKYAIMKISSFDNDLSFEFQHKYESWFVEMMRAGNRMLILDLRDNIGGNQNNATKLFASLIDRPQYFGRVPKSYIKDLKKAFVGGPGVEKEIIPSKNAYKWKIYLLVNGGTFSAAAILAANLQAINDNITIVGEESGGGREGCTGGTFKNFHLSNSNLTLSHGEIPLKTLGNYPTRGHGVLPDIKIKYTIDDHLAKHDLEMEWVVNDIKSK